ncbi:hypothetical protein BSL82_05795 [Tardibacter chloracetimidivorans]|uniref:Uncharacterized protein n=1 Tax=Tardibacter chloracetimidivorans TaxID=1921510 RepID=A0A1L3ZTB5_9SPHN|nr:hypothetical protein [Tardibacter chloracetimidivorans]API58882.1 hypothetical protein BSL82_05795 [Tardibacter chloracetimidivorans]
MTDAADLEIARDVRPRDRRAVLEMRADHPVWVIAAYLEIEVIQVEAVIRCADDGTLPCPGDDDILAHEAVAGWQGALTHEGALHGKGAPVILGMDLSSSPDVSISTVYPARGKP